MFVISSKYFFRFKRDSFIHFIFKGLKMNKTICIYHHFLSLNANFFVAGRERMREREMNGEKPEGRERGREKRK